MRAKEPIWMTVKSAGLEENHRRWLVDTAARVAFDRAALPPPIFVNIGIYYGASMHCLRAGAPDAVLVGVDKKDWGIFKRDLLDAAYLWQDSGECWMDFDQEVDLLFVDGATRYEQVKRDIWGWCPKVAFRGLAVFNCYHLPGPRWDVKKALDEWLEAHESQWEDMDAPHPIRAIRRVA